MAIEAQPYAVNGYIELGYLAQIFNVYPATIRRRLRSRGLHLYAHPGDRRFRLVAEEDVRVIFKIIPAPDRPSRSNGMQAPPPK